MKYCGVLCIDYVLGLLCLWWILKGENVMKGVYIYYLVKDMLVILVFEFYCYQCSVIGEDLGIVLDEIVELLCDVGVYLYKVFFFEMLKEDGGYVFLVYYVE